MKLLSTSNLNNPYYPENKKHKHIIRRARAGDIDCGGEGVNCKIRTGENNEDTK